MKATIEKFEIFAIRVKITTSTSCGAENWKNIEKGKQTCSSTIGLDGAVFYVPTHQHSIGYMGDDYRSKDPTNSYTFSCKAHLNYQPV